MTGRILLLNVRSRFLKQALHSKGLTCTSIMLTAEFEGLKDELERLLCKNKGLTRAGSPQTAAASYSSSNSNQSSGARGTDSSWRSMHSSSHSQNSSCSSCSSTLLGRSDSQPAQPISAAEQASQQLNHDVDILLKQVDSVMAVPVLQLPSWFTKKPAAPSCTVTELPLADQAPPTSLSRQSRVVTPKLKPTSVSAADSYTSACQDANACIPASTATSAAQHPSTKACSAASSQSTDIAAERDSSISLSSTSAAHGMMAREPDNLSILHFACATSPSQSHDTVTTIKSSRQAHTDDQPSPKEWHTNHMADSDGSVSSTADSIQPAPSSAAAAAAVPSAAASGKDGGTSGLREARSRSSRRRGSQSCSPPHSNTITSITQVASPERTIRIQDEVTDPERDQDDLHVENVAPGWHRQPLQTLKKSGPISAMLVHPQDGDDAQFTRGSAGQGGLLEGYLKGSSAKLQLPASVRTGSRKTAITARTPLKTITEVWLSNCAPLSP